jgi:Cys-tRNA(Pro) deacylase
MTAALSPSSEKVQQALISAGFSNKVIEMKTPTRSAAEAAETVGCQVGQIAKSLVFRGQSTQRPVLVIASGANRVDEGKLAAALDEPMAMARPDDVRALTGFAIGGVPPLGHQTPMKTLIDADLMTHELIWAAAGTPRAMFSLTPDDLLRMTGAEVKDIRKE